MRSRQASDRTSAEAGAAQRLSPWTASCSRGKMPSVTTQRFTISWTQRVEALRRQMVEGRLGHVGPDFPRVTPAVPGTPVLRFKVTHTQRVEALRRQIAEGRLGHVGPSLPRS